jgi:hypothetical protein
MVRRLVSLAMGVFILDVYIRSQLTPNDPLFLFVSANAAINTGLILLSYLLIIVSFSRKFANWFSYAGCAILAVVLLIVGGLGLFPGLFSQYWISNNLLPMDSMLVLEAGVILALCSLTYEHAAQPEWLKNFNLAAWRRWFAFPAPKIPHSPTWLDSLFNRTPPLSKAH